MASQRHSKKEGPLCQDPARKMPQGEPSLEEDVVTGEQGERMDGEAPLTRSFMEQLFRALRGDFATLKQEIAEEVKELKRDVVELGQRVDTLEQSRDAREEEVDWRRRELLILQDTNLELQYQLEDLENRSRYGAPYLKDQTLVLDRTHRVGRPAYSPGQAQDILTCLHHYKQREIIMLAARDHPVIDFEGFCVGLF
ncbi:hypothetical protein NDU88_003977 [Pleurodeles waltl]|uniref:Uncharacterized protein n=1 Tax=Pleurodeles waltl TaxID=8319 RepID=A0AAV7LIK8_PLEWA|nr:hypothetical protein NDU88_003977 [Pleurodeles waltl]